MKEVEGYLALESWFWWNLNRIFVYVSEIFKQQYIIINVNILNFTIWITKNITTQVQRVKKMSSQTGQTGWNQSLSGQGVQEKMSVVNMVQSTYHFCCFSRCTFVVFNCLLLLTTFLCLQPKKNIIVFFTIMIQIYKSFFPSPHNISLQSRRLHTWPRCDLGQNSDRVGGQPTLATFLDLCQLTNLVYPDYLNHFIWQKVAWPEMSLIISHFTGKVCTQL